MHNKITYRKQFTRCGKERCKKCREGEGHGPYWYAYWSEKGRTISKYIGTHLPADVKIEQLNQKNDATEREHDTSQTRVNEPILRVYLLGQFRVEHRQKQEWKVVDNHIWQRRRVRALLGCLLSSPGRKLGREQVMELIWPDVARDIAVNRLNGAVHELRQILEPHIARPAASRLLRLEHNMLELADSSQVWVDVEAFEQLLKEAQAARLDAARKGQVEHLLEEAASLYGGGYLLEELYSEWAIPRRDALQRRWVDLQLDLVQLYIEQKNVAGAIEKLDHLRGADPLNETALQLLMILLTHQKRRGEALQLYHQHEGVLRRDSDNEPFAETRELYEKLRTGYSPPLPVALPQDAVQRSKQGAILSSSYDTDTTAASVTSQEDKATLFTRPALQLNRYNRSPFVGREQELQSMWHALLSVEESGRQSSPQHALVSDEISGYQHPPLPTSFIQPKQPHFLLLIGEPGIGKTRLAEELSIQAYAHDWAIVWSRAHEQKEPTPYHAWIELLHSLLYKAASPAENSEDRENKTSAFCAQFPSYLKLEHLSPVLPELNTSAHSSEEKKASAFSYDQKQLYVWEATLGLLDFLSKIHPILLVLDDLHWTDESSIELLTYLAHHLQDQRIFFVGTCRDGELAVTHKLHSLVAGLRREQAIVTLTVQPLTQSQIGLLVSHLPHAIVERIQKQAAGNPFFAEELARYMNTAPHVDMPAIPLAAQEQERHASLLSAAQQPRTVQSCLHSHHWLPDTVAALLERRLNRLSSDCQSLLGKAAVLGSSFTFAQIRAMVSEQGEDTVLDLLEEALYEGLLTEEGCGPHVRYHFWHPLIVSHMYERLSAAQRAQFHRRAIEAIKATLPPSP